MNTEAKTPDFDAEFDAMVTRLDDQATASDNPHRAVAAEMTEPRPADAHDCFECNGTGRFLGTRIHQPKSHCFACKGRGWFKTSYADRIKAKVQREAREAAKKADAQSKFMEANPDLVEGLRAIAGWHQFAGKLVADFDKWNRLTEKQIIAGRSVLAKVAEKRAERAAEQAKRVTEVPMASIQNMFDTARGNGLKRPRFVTARLVMSLAPATGRNAGAVYVKCDGAYAGKIVSGKFIPLREAPAEVGELVQAVAADPVEAARRYGKDTGTCACCGRPLTDPQSIANGIGPVCESKWF